MPIHTSTLIRAADPDIRSRRSAPPTPEAGAVSSTRGHDDRNGQPRTAPPAYPSRRRPASPLGIAATILAVVVAAAVTTLVLTVPDGTSITALEGPSLAAGVVGISAGVIGFLLAYIAAVQSQH
jgi:hypothetical protein